MKFEDFKEVIERLQKLNDAEQLFYKNGIDLYGFIDGYVCIISKLLKEIYGSIASEYIDWWLYEDVEKKLYDGDKVIGDLTELKDLWKHIEKLRKMVRK